MSLFYECLLCILECLPYSADISSYLCKSPLFNYIKDIKEELFSSPFRMNFA